MSEKRELMEQRNGERKLGPDLSTFKPHRKAT